MTGTPPIPQSGFVSLNLDEAKRKATQFPTKIQELSDRRQEIADKLLKGRCGVVLGREILALVGEVLDFFT